MFYWSNKDSSSEEKFRMDGFSTIEWLPFVHLVESALRESNPEALKLIVTEEGNALSFITFEDLTSEQLVLTVDLIDKFVSDFGQLNVVGAEVWNQVVRPNLIADSRYVLN